MLPEQLPGIYNFFKAWNRLESRPRKHDFTRALKAEIYDALWMLTRQWQIGEFKGEDTASAIAASIQIQTSKITRYQNKDNPYVLYTDDVPLETRVERLNFKFDYKTRIQTGKQWLKIVKNFGVLYNENLVVSGQNDVFDYNIYSKLFLKSFPIDFPVFDDNDTVKNQIKKAKEISDTGAFHFLEITYKNNIDGVNLINFLKSNIPLETRIEILPAHLGIFQNAVSDYIEWFENLYNLPLNSNDSSWNNNRMEYNFACSAPEKIKNDTITKRTILTADEYSLGHLDWYSFNIETKKDTYPTLITEEKSIEDIEKEVVKKHLFTILPSGIQFSGMPKSRWWEFEDGNVNLDDISASPSEIGKTILLDFALMFSNDWLLVPYTVPVGSISEVQGIIINDTFGDRTWIESAGLGEEENWRRWNMYTLSSNDFKNNNTSGKYADIRLFIPPAINKALESAPLEKVNMIRDEMANLVWGIEKEIPSMLGKSINGQEAANKLVEMLRNLASNANPKTNSDPSDIVFKYELGNEISENWIPFIPVQKDNSEHRSIILQRASFPRLIDPYYKNNVVRPRTSILRVGINDDDIVNENLFVNEEEVPRTGVFISSSFQRTRWYNGKTFLWYGQKKQIGKGEGSSGLKFDTLKDV
jgi:hypothetical protein